MTTAIYIKSMRTSNELQIGKAGEYLVCADAVIMGLIAYPSEQGLPYDVVIDTGKSLLKCQVKTTSGVRTVPQRNTESKAYIFNIKRHGKNAQKRYGIEEVDLFALCDLETRSVIYLQSHDLPETINIRSDALRGTYYDEKGAIDFKNVQRLFAEGRSRREISEALSLNYSTVSRMTNADYKPYVSQARYWSDYKKTKEWFYEL